MCATVYWKMGFFSVEQYVVLGCVYVYMHACMLTHVCVCMVHVVCVCSVDVSVMWYMHVSVYIHISLRMCLWKPEQDAGNFLP